MTLPAIDQRIALCLTVLNEAAGLQRFLGTVAAQTLLPREIVVVDGGSKDATVSIAESFILPAGVTMHVIVRGGANISEGRNAAISEAATEWIAVTDAGTELVPEWLEQLAARMDDSTDVVGGFFEPLPGGPMQSAIGAVITPTVKEIDPGSFLPSSRSVAFRKSAWAGVGGYPEWLDYCEDLVFDLSLRTSGARFVFASEAVAKWDARPSLRAFAKQYYRYARGDGKAGLWRKRHIARYLAYVTLAVSTVVSIVSGRPWVLLTIPFAASYIRKPLVRALRHPMLTRRERTIAVLLTPVIVATGDVAKMFGYPAGLVWRRRNRASG